MHSIRLKNAAFEGENTVYLLGTSDDDRTTLIDTGIASPSVRADLESGLAEHGVRFADVEEILITHYHYDHAGLAGSIQAESDATVRVHRDDASLVAGDGGALDSMKRRMVESFERWGMPADARNELTSFLDRTRSLRGEAVRVDPFEGGDTISLGTSTLTALELPGHTAGHAGFILDDAATEIAVGDALLPKYTPNVGGADVRVERPLETYLETLRTIVDHRFERAWPGHRDPIDDPGERACEIIDHHRDRTMHIIRILRERGSATAWTVSADLFGSLATIHILHGPGEAYAHLDHLERKGIVAREGIEYRLLDGSVSLDELIPPDGSS